MVVADIVERLLRPGSMWIDEERQSYQLISNDIRVVTPFNAQVARIREALLRGASSMRFPSARSTSSRARRRPLPIYSMATSHPDDAPKGMEFLYNLNRLNVATSRAQVRRDSGRVAAAV